MKLQEFQGKELFKDYGITVPESQFIPKNEKTIKINLEYPFVVKSQVLAGGRGKAGLVKFVKNQEEFDGCIEHIMTSEHRGEKPVGVLLEAAAELDKEYYLSILVNRQLRCLSLIFSSFGGVDIEEVAKSNKEQIHTVHLDHNNSIEDLREDLFLLKDNLKNDIQFETFVVFCSKLLKLFTEKDLMMIEINPFIFVNDTEISALDAVVEIDDSASFRHPDIFEEAKKIEKYTAETKEENPFGNHYVELDGNVGILGCGAGIVMASMDMIRSFGGKPANFLDIGGGANKKTTVQALEILHENTNIKSIFINIFGGITFCDEIAKAIIDFRATRKRTLPLIIRMMGNNAKEAIRLLKDNGIFAFNNMEKAAEKAVKLANKKYDDFFISSQSKILVQGITGKYGSHHTKKMMNYGTKIVAGVSQNKNHTEMHGVPVYNSVKDAVKNHDIDVSVMFVPAPFAKSAAFEAIDAKIPLLVIITEHIPVRDTMEIIQYANENETKVIGPNCPGMIRVNQANLGIIPGHIFQKGNVAVLSKSGTLLYEIASGISLNAGGISTAIGLGGDPVTGTSILDAIQYFEKSSESKYIVYIGEIGGGEEEERLRDYLADNNSKPIIAFFAGQSAPSGAKMGHAGAIIQGEKSTIAYKKKILSEAGCHIADLPSDIHKIINKLENN
ncbi:MAG: succinate--CoA ligase subunit alpha [Candidatus Cloacimonadota bacterium]|nr:MAG: succinate--CoA ligase subunit alpha [Candidatus Cloacimonadota bacterium]